MDRRTEVPQGTLDLLILKALDLEAMHGSALMQRLEQLTNGMFQVTAGSMFPALQRMEENGWIKGEWSTSENNRRAKVYAITKSGRKQLERKKERWTALVSAIANVLDATS